MFRIPLSPSVLDIKSSRGAEVGYGTNAALRGKFHPTICAYSAADKSTQSA
jgi:hypothetical protein